MITAACMCDAQTWGAATAQLILMSMSAMLISNSTLQIPQVGAGCLSAAYLGLTWLADQLLWSSVKKAKQLINNWSDMKLISWEVVSPYTEVVEKLCSLSTEKLVSWAEISWKINQLGFCCSSIQLKAEILRFAVSSCGCKWSLWEVSMSTSSSRAGR